MKKKKKKMKKKSDKESQSMKGLDELSTVTNLVRVKFQIDNVDVMQLVPFLARAKNR